RFRSSGFPSPARPAAGAAVTWSNQMSNFIEETSPGIPDPARGLVIDYTNYEGKRSTRTIRPLHVWYGSNQWHKEPCWLLHAWDADKKAFRDFALTSIHSVSKIPPT